MVANSESQPDKTLPTDRTLLGDEALELPASLADMLSEFTDRVQRGDPFDDEEFLCQHAEHAQELRPLLPTARALASIGAAGVELEAGGEVEVSPYPRLGRLGDFQLIRQIGKGGMGVVYEAEQLSLSRRVALKILPFAAMLDERRLQRFRNEALAAAQLHHTNIVPVYSVGCERGIHFYAMQYIEGQTLEEILRQLRRNPNNKESSLNDADRRSPAPIGDASDSIAEGDATKSIANLSTGQGQRSPHYFRNVAEMFIQVAEALEYAHQMDVAHRDIKPSNLILDTRGRLWIADFGLARMGSESNLTFTGEILGTLRYMSPEQFEGDRSLLDHRTDIYSLGATLYELLTLQPAFTEQNRPKLIREVLETDPRAPRLIDASIPSELETIVLKALEKSPADRYESIQSLANDLRRFLNHLPLAARRPTLWERSRKWLRRHRSLAWTIAAAMTVVSLVLATAVWRVASDRIALVNQRNEANRQRQEVLKAEAALRRELHVADMRLAADAARLGFADELRAKLDRYLPRKNEQDLRGFAWRYLNNWRESSSRLHRELLMLEDERAKGFVDSIAISPNDEVVASAGRDGVLRFWDAMSGDLRSAVHAHDAGVNSVSFDPRGDLLATAGDRNVRLWRVANGEPIATFAEFSLEVYRVRYAPDGEFFVASELDTTTQACASSLWEVASGKRIHRWEGEFVIAIDPDSKLIATTRADRSVRLRDRDSGEICGEMKGHSDFVPAGAFTPDGKRLLTGDYGNDVIIWDVDAKRAIDRFGVRAVRLAALALSPDGRFLSAGGDGGDVQILHVPSHSVYCTIRTEQGSQESHAFSHDGRFLFTCGSDSRIRRWNVSRSTPHVCLPEHERPIVGVALLKNGKHLAVIDGQSCVRFWPIVESTLPKNEVHTSEALSGKPATIAASPTENVVAVGDRRGRVHLVEAPSGKCIKTWLVSPERPHGLEFSRDGRLLATCDSQMVVKVWKIASQELVYEVSLRSANHESFGIYTWNVNALSLPSSTSELWIAGSHSFRCDFFQGDARFWAVEKAVAFACEASRDGRWVAMGFADASIKLYDAHSKTEQAKLLGHSAHITAIAFSPDAKTLASGSVNGELKLWDLESRQQLLALPGHTGPVRMIEFSEDGSVMATFGPTVNGKGDVWLWFARPPKS